MTYEVGVILQLEPPRRLSIKREKKDWVAALTSESFLWRHELAYLNAITAYLPAKKQ